MKTALIHNLLRFFTFPLAVQKAGYLFLMMLVCTETPAQLIDRINPELLNKTWQARWITSPAISGSEFGVYLFRKTFTAPSEAKQFIIHVSADNRYKLYVNEKYIGNGPARGDFMKWRFESLDIGPYLKNGENVITAVVWNFAGYRPLAQFSSQTGLIVQGNTTTEHIINTDSTWHIFQDSAYAPLPVNIGHYYVTGPGEKFNSGRHPWKWMQADFNDANWKHAKELEHGTPLKSFRQWGAPSRYILVPREIPPMEESAQRFSKVRRSGLPGITDQFLMGEKAVVIPARSKITILLDQGHLTNAYPVLSFSKGKSSEIKITYAESLFDNQLNKGNRNDIANKKMIGNKDIVVADGGDNRTFQTLWWRTFRYIEMEIETKDEPLTITDFYSVFTGYPFVEKASFACNDPLMSDIWKVGWRTQRLCAGETYFDCPYYEQLQYAGDSRIQCFVSTYVSGDTTMMRNAVAAIHDSRLPFGLTQSRYPGYQTQIIPTFSLVWINMVHDYWMLCNDQQFVKSMIPGIMDVLDWYESRVDASGMTGPLEWWNFVDWVIYKDWDTGIPPGLYGSHSSIVNLQYAYSLQKAAALLEASGLKEQATRYANMADRITSVVYTTCYDTQKGYIADSPEKRNFSQHANALAVLTNAVPKAMQPELMQKIMNAKDIAECSYYYRFYLTEAMDKAGLSAQFPDMLGPWKQMLEQGLTTFAEEPEPSRSDCHAWSASPVYYFLSLVCGIKPGEPGFKSVRIEPHPGRLNWIKGAMPHRLGAISVNLKKDKQNNLTGEVTLPGNLAGVFVWNGQTVSLKGGVNAIGLK